MGPTADRNELERTDKNTVCITFRTIYRFTVMLQLCTLKRKYSGILHIHEVAMDKIVLEKLFCAIDNDHLEHCCKVAMSFTCYSYRVFR